MKPALLISAFTPDPTGIGPAQRAHGWLELLAREHDVHLLTVRPPYGLLGAREDLHGGVPVASHRRISAVGRGPGYRWRMMRAFAGHAVLRRPSHFIGWHAEWLFLDGPARRKLAEWYGGAAFSRVVCLRLAARDIARFLTQEGIVPERSIELDLDDLESDTRRSIAKGLWLRGRRLEAMAGLADAWHVAAVERAVLPEFSRVFVCVEQDRIALGRRMPGIPVEVMATVLPGLPPRAPPGDAHDILFVGTLGYFPNEDAVRFFAETALPLLRAEDPRWRLQVAGRAPPPSLRRWLESRPGVGLRADPDDITGFYRGAGTVVSPVRYGGGTKVKVLEALAHGRPLVACAHSVRGLSLEAGRHFLPAESGGEFAGACRRLAADPGLALRLADAGREWAVSHALPSAQQPPGK